MQCTNIIHMTYFCKPMVKAYILNKKVRSSNTQPIEFQKKIRNMYGTFSSIFHLPWEHLYVVWWGMCIDAILTDEANICPSLRRLWAAN